MILAAVMLLVALGALTSVGVLFRSSAEAFTVSASGRSARARAVARSGLAGVMREMETQRLRIFAGDEPILTDELTLEQADGRIGVVRIIRVRASAARPESAKININHATEETLGRLALVGPDLAATIVAARPFASIDDLLRVEGVTPELLYGDMRALLADESSTDEELVAGDAATALRDVLTVHGFWPPIQLGAGESGATFAGERRINLNTPWSEELGRAVARRYSQDIANGLQGIMEQGLSFKNEADIVNILVQLGSDTSGWAEVFDSFCATDAPALAGRVDVSRAPVEVLAALPGLDDTAARSIAAAALAVDRSALVTVAWPVTSGAIDGQTLSKCIDSIAPSSAQWRITIEAGFLPVSAEDDDDLPPLDQRIVLEAVVDISTPRARLAELTDITDLPLIVGWRLQEPREEDEDDAGGEAPPEPVAPDTLPPTDQPDPAPPETDMDPDDSENANPPVPAPPPDHRVGRYRVPGASNTIGEGGGR